MRWRAAEGYTCVMLEGQNYLLPYGQKIVDFHMGLQINETGALLWNALGDGAGEEELLEMLCGHFEAKEDEIPQIRQDLQEFLGQLAQRGAAVREECPDYAARYSSQPLFFRAGSLRIAYGGPEPVYEKYFRRFACEGGEADQRAEVMPCRPLATQNGRVLVRSGDFLLMEAGEGYIMLFPAFPDIYEMHVSRDGSLCRVCCSPEMSEEEQEHIFHALRFAFLVLAQSRGLAVVHSSSLLYGNRAWLFSGRSGTGKSTHANLWRDAWGTELLNGDLNCLGLKEDKVWVYGIPWCGTSGIATPETYPLGGVAFLKQWKENLVQELTEAEKACQLAMRMITPTWTAEMLKQNLVLAERIVRRCMAARLLCTGEREAAEVMRRHIDGYCGRQ